MKKFYVLQKSDNRCVMVIPNYRFFKDKKLNLSIMYSIESNYIIHKRICEYFYSDSFNLSIPGTIVEELMVKLGYKVSRWFDRRRLISYLRNKLYNFSRDIQDNLNEEVIIDELLSKYNNLHLKKGIIFLMDNSDIGSRYLDFSNIKQLIYNVLITNLD